MKENSNKEKLKGLLKELFALAKTQKFADITLKDGSILRTADDTLAKGSQVTLVSADGVESAAADGDVTANDGSVITIKSGVVDNLGAAPAPATMAAPTAMASPATPTDSTAVPATDDSSDTGSEMDGMDMANLVELIKNLVERVASLEGSMSSTSMTVEKMSAAPAAKPFNFDPFKDGTIGSEVMKYKAEHKAKLEQREKQILEFSQKKKIVSPEKTENRMDKFSGVRKENQAPLFPGSFSIDGGN